MQNNIIDVLPETTVREADIRKYLEGDDLLQPIDPVAPLKFNDPATAASWIVEMSKGNYGGANFKTLAELNEAVEALPLDHVALLRFLTKVTAGRLHVADQSERKHTWLIWNGRIYDAYNQKYTNTITTSLIDILDIINDDYFSRASDVLSDSKMQKSAAARLNKITTFIDGMRKSSGLRGFREIMLADLSLSFDEDAHANDSVGYVVEADGRLRHMDNLSIIADPDPSLLITRTLNVCTTDDWVDHGEWSQFLLETFGHPDGKGGFIRDEGKERLLKQAAGVALIGTGQTKHMIHILGTGNSGKSFYLDALSRVFGDYGKPLPSSAIVKMTGVNFQQDEARGIRFLFLSEPDTSYLDGPFVKTLTGGSTEQITTSRKGLSGITWSPQCVFHVVSNDPLKFNAADTPLNKRILTITAENSVEEDDPRFDPNRVNKIVSKDIESIYRWCLEGAQEFLDNGGKLDIPDEILEIQKSRADTANTAVQWLNEKIEDGIIQYDSEAKSLSHMYKWNKSDYLDYSAWCAANGYKPYDDSKLRELINNYMKKPGSKNATGKVAGYYRLWGLVEGPKKFEAPPV